MRASSSINRIVRSASSLSRPIQNVRYASTVMKMPAMSPTMTEGGIAGWKKSEGEAFSAGEILLEVETDKATIDVEAQDDGIMGKILVQSGTQKIPVGKPIAILAEEGDDLSNLEIPKEEAEAEIPKRDQEESSEKKVSHEPTPAPKQQASPKKHAEHKEIKHAQPLFPSVLRLLAESDLSSEQISKLKGSGKGGMLTKGDVLVALGQLKNPWGSAEKLTLDVMGPSGKRASEDAPSGSKVVKEAPLDAATIRRSIVAGMAKASAPAVPIVEHASTPLPLSADADFDALLAPYASLLPPSQPALSLPSTETLEATKSSSGQVDEYAGLY